MTTISPRSSIYSQYPYSCSCSQVVSILWKKEIRCECSPSMAPHSSSLSCYYHGATHLNWKGYTWRWERGAWLELEPSFLSLGGWPEWENSARGWKTRGLAHPFRLVVVGPIVSAQKNSQYNIHLVVTRLFREELSIFGLLLWLFREDNLQKLGEESLEGETQATTEDLKEHNIVPTTSTSWNGHCRWRRHYRRRQ